MYNSHNVGKWYRCNNTLIFNLRTTMTENNIRTRVV